MVAGQRWRSAHLVVTCPDGSGARELTSGPWDDAVPSWSADGTRIAFSSNRAGAYEILSRDDVPARVVVSEYVDVANAFVEREETGMVNAVLDQIARQLRAEEFGVAAG